MAETTITIKVEGPRAATSIEVDGVAGMSAPTTDPGTGAPAPALLAGPGESTAEVGDTGEAPPPMELSELGIGGANEAASEDTGPPPADLVEGTEADEPDVPEPMPIEDLDEKPPGRSSRSKKS